MDEERTWNIEEIKKTIDVKFTSTGFETEEQVALTLLKDNWYTMRNPRYYVKSEDRYKEMDILARKSLKPDSFLRFLLVIECKKQEKWPWVFLQGSTKIRNPFSVSFATQDRLYGHVYSILEDNFKDHFYFGADASTAHLSPTYLFGSKEERKFDPIKDAIDQTISHFIEAISLESDTLEKAVPRVTLVHPVIVLNGKLLAYDISKKELKETKHVHYLFEMLAKEPMPIAGKIVQTKPVVIDVVQLDYFKDFLSIVQEQRYPTVAK
ncbi:MAG: hypothetical protein ACYCQJ_10525 [Nitrososphaerales archaeon]